MPFVDSSELSAREPLPGWTGRFFNSPSMTFAYYEIAADAQPLHEHHHVQEEVWHVLDGKLAVTIDGKEHVTEAGCAAIVPPNIPHSARALTACRAIVVDTPLRDQVAGVRTTD